MKIRPKSLESQNELLQTNRNEQTKSDQVRADIARANQLNADRARSDKIQMSSLASSMSDLNPTQFLQDRQTKIDSIKEQIKNGTYNPSSESIAQSLAEEISLEILTAGGLLGRAEN